MAEEIKKTSFERCNNDANQLREEDLTQVSGGKAPKTRKENPGDSWDCKGNAILDRWGYQPDLTKIE